MQPLGCPRRQKIELRPAGPLVYEKLSDPILVKRAKDGDREALAALCERHAPRVERLAAHLLSDPEDARDAAQDALAKLCVRIRQFRGEAQFTTWLHRVTVNACYDVLRKKKREPMLETPREEDAPEPPGPASPPTATRRRRSPSPSSARSSPPSSARFRLGRRGWSC